MPDGKYLVLGGLILKNRVSVSDFLDSVGNESYCHTQIKHRPLIHYFLLFFRSALLNCPAIVLIYTLTCLAGLTVFAYYSEKGCDPLANGDIESSNQVNRI